MDIKTTDKTIVILGGGNLGTRLAHVFAFLHRVILAGRKKRKPSAAFTYTTDNVKAVQQADILIVTVRPDDVVSLFEEIRGHLKPHTLVISFVKNFSLSEIEGCLGKNILLCRAMTSVFMGDDTSIVGIYAKNTRKKAKDILSALGTVINFPTEEKLQLSTALIGSTPGLLASILRSFASEYKQVYGFNTAEVRLALVSAVVGMSRVLSDEKDIEKAFDMLIDAVATKGGCTERGLSVLKSSAFQRSIKETLEATKQGLT